MLAIQPTARGWTLMSEQNVPIQERTQTPSHANRSQPEVVSVIRHTVASGKELAYETWLREIVPIAVTASGHRGVNIIRPQAASRTYTTVLRFDGIEHLEQWLASEVRQRLIEKVQQLLEDGDHIRRVLRRPLRTRLLHQPSH
jgi:antibiotic biosynthesis monooxygenase (ABM) superfamily enzyme